MTSHLNAPHGGKLVDLHVSPSRAKEIKEQSRDWPSWDLTPRQLCDLEMLCNGSFSPLTGFMKKADYESVCSDKMRLADGTLWTMPITLDVSKEFAEKIKPGDHIALRDAEGVMLAVIKAEDIVDAVARESRSGDLVVVMSNGGFDDIHQKLLLALERRARR